MGDAPSYSYERAGISAHSLGTLGSRGGLKRYEGRVMQSSGETSVCEIRANHA